MGLRGSHTHELVFKNCLVPKENVIGGMDMVGQGFKTAMRVLDKGRLSIGACALGASMVKVFCTEMASQIADKALNIFSMEGCLTENRVEIFLRDVRLYRIYEGTSEIQKIIISRNLLNE